VSAALDTVKLVWRQLQSGIADAGRMTLAGASLTALHPDMVAIEPDALPYGGTHHGRDRFVQLLAEVQDLYVPLKPFDQTFIDLDPLVIVRSRGPARATATGVEFQFEVSTWWTVRDAQVVEIYHYYFDTATILLAAGVVTRT
jgi:ketosteroid isomerase-like protein